MKLPEDPRAPGLGSKLGGKYTLVRFLAEGGMGAVYEAETPGEHGPERVAVKVLLEASRAAGESGALARFIREAQVSSSLSSPHIVRVYDGGIDPELHVAYIAMQLLSGDDLETLVGRVGPLHPQVAARIALQAAKGLEVAHAAGIVHRDIKPSNLFLDVRGGEVTVKLCDFGIAKIHPAGDEQNLTGTGHVLGSPLYMSPEQMMSSRSVDARTDVWSLAMTLYHALAGQAPLQDLQSFTELVLAITTQPIPLLQDRAPWVEPQLASLVHAGLLHDLGARCPSIAAFGRALAEHAGGAFELTASMLEGAPPALRQKTAPRALYPTTWEEATSSRRGPDPLLGKTLAGRYYLKTLIGEGGMGAVYGAVGPGGAEVAVKVLRPDRIGVSPDAMRRMVREARMAMSIRSEHVVKMTEVDTDMTMGVPFISMELLRGRDLAALVHDAGPLEPSAVCRVFVDACRGLAAAHALGVIHRDIKPANLFLHETDGGAIVVKVCDFGIAKQTSQAGAFDETSTDLTRTGGMLGSPLYMSPEQAKNAKGVDLRTDIWSLCMSMYEALAGQKAWAGYSSAGELVLAICTQDVRPLQDLAPWVPSPIAEAVHRGLRREARERTPTVDDLLAELAPHAARCPELTRAALTSLTPDQKRMIADRAPVVSPVSTQGTSGSATLTTASGGAAPRPRRSPLLLPGLGLFALTTFGAAVFLVSRTGEHPSDAAAQVAVRPDSAQAPPSASVQVVPIAPPVSAHVAISPPDARVSVAGQPRTLQNGDLLLEGEAGDHFTVVVELDQSRQKVEVNLRRDGTADPSSITLAAGPKAAGRGADPGTKPLPKGPGPATPAVSAAPKVDAPPAGIGTQKVWR